MLYRYFKLAPVVFKLINSRSTLKTGYEWAGRLLTNLPNLINGPISNETAKQTFADLFLLFKCILGLISALLVLLAQYYPEFFNESLLGMWATIREQLIVFKNSINPVLAPKCNWFIQWIRDVNDATINTFYNIFSLQSLITVEKTVRGLVSFCIDKTLLVVSIIVSNPAGILSLGFGTPIISWGIYKTNFLWFRTIIESLIVFNTEFLRTFAQTFVPILAAMQDFNFAIKNFIIVGLGSFANILFLPINCILEGFTVCLIFGTNCLVFLTKLITEISNFLDSCYNWFFSTPTAGGSSPEGPPPFNVGSGNDGNTGGGSGNDGAGGSGAGARGDSGGSSGSNKINTQVQENTTQVDTTTPTTTGTPMDPAAVDSSITTVSVITAVSGVAAVGGVTTGLIICVS